MKDTIELMIDGGHLAIAIQMSRNDTIAQLKDKIRNQMGVEVARQTLYSAYEVQMSDAETIGNYYEAERAGGTVRLAVQAQPPGTEFRVVVGGPDPEYEVEFLVKETDSVLELKRRIEEDLKEREGLRPQDIELRLDGARLDNDRPLSAYHLDRGSWLDCDFDYKDASYSSSVSST